MEVCSTADDLRRALATKPRTRARVPITQELHRHLAQTRMRALDALRGPRRAGAPGGYRDTLELGAAGHNTAPEMAYWVEYVIYDDGYETPDEFGDPAVDWTEGHGHEDIRDVSKLDLTAA